MPWKADRTCAQEGARKHGVCEQVLYIWRERLGGTGHRQSTQRLFARVRPLADDRGELDMPRDRNGQFNPLLIPKYARRFRGFDDRIIALLPSRNWRCNSGCGSHTEFRIGLPDLLESLVVWQYNYFFSTRNI